jgi:hypothetical protein
MLPPFLSQQREPLDWKAIGTISEMGAVQFGGKYLGPIRLSNFEEELMAAVVWMWEHYEDTMFSGIEGSIIISNLLLYGIGADKTSDQKVLHYNNNQY